MEKAIKKAIEGGWDYLGATQRYWETHWQEVCMRPDFWQALGKVENWDEKNYCGNYRSCWEQVWHDFINHLSSGGSVDDFFNSLIN